MSRKLLLTVLVVLALASMSCRLFSLPVQRVQTGAIQTKEINIPVPEGADVVDLDLQFGAGQLNLTGGAQDALVDGEARYNLAEFEPTWDVSGSRVTLEAGEFDLKGFPQFNTDNLEHVWDLELGDVPMNLTIGSGAYQGRIDLGGLAIESLEVSDGAADVQLDFSKPNAAEMSRFVYSTGASNIELKNLSNANFGSMVFRSGAGNYTLDFTGDLQRDADVRIESGISQVTIVVPEGTAAEVTFTGGLSNVDASGWQQSGDRYSLSGDGPTLSISVEMGAGQLRLRAR